MHQRFVGKMEDDDTESGLRLAIARRRMCTEVLFLINELFTEFYSSLAATVCGMILRESSVIKLLSNQMEWSIRVVLMGASMSMQLP